MPSVDAFDGLAKPTDSFLQALGAQAERVAPQMSAQDVAQILNTYVLLRAQPPEALLQALYTRGRQVLQDMKASDVAIILAACGHLKKVPDGAFWSELQDRGHEVAGQMTPREVADSLNAFNVLGQQPKPVFMEDLRKGVVANAKDMGPSAVAEAMESANEMGLKGDALWTALGKRAQVVVQYFSPDEVVGSLEAYTSLKRQPPVELWQALGKRMGASAPQMDVKGVSHLLGVYAKASQTLNREPDEGTVHALKARATERAQNMDLEDLRSNYNALAILQALKDGKALPAGTVSSGDAAAAAASLAAIEQAEPAVEAEASELPPQGAPAGEEVVEAEAVPEADVEAESKKVDEAGKEGKEGAETPAAG